MPDKMDFFKLTTRKVLDFFFAHPAAEFHEREVLRSTGISKGSANKILRDLAGQAILCRTEKGRMVFYRLNADDPFVKQVKVLWNVWALRSLVRGMKESTRKILAFGSSAEGTDASESDIDILILPKEQRTANEQDFEHGMYLRQETDYGLKFLGRGAQGLIEIAEKMFEKAKPILDLK